MPNKFQKLHNYIVLNLYNCDYNLYKCDVYIVEEFEALAKRYNRIVENSRRETHSPVPAATLII